MTHAWEKHVKAVFKDNFYTKDHYKPKARTLPCSGTSVKVCMN